MTKAAMTKTALFLLAAAGLHAQTAVSGTAFQEIGLLPSASANPLSGQAVPASPVVGKPFSGREERHTSQTLSDGTNVERHSVTMFCRDAQGRTRSQNENLVVIVDPVEGYTYRLSTADKTAARSPLVGFQPRPSPPPAALLALTVHEALAPQQMNGVWVRGERSTVTIPPRAIGNDREVKIVNESWYSDDLQVLVKSKNSDPRFGVTAYELTGIVQAAPDSSRFQVPRGYTHAFAVQANRDSSLDHYQRAESYFLKNQYQPAANAFRDALNGDLEPRWIEVWSHIYLGKIFDTTGQRERAVNEYNLAIRTKDDTNGAQAEANRYLKTPYK